ncbi:thermonuclease family protein [Methanococcus voltae]|uniref:Nuclease (SNase domain protein) n=1 Tax=Methanococcus voltae (strain ATCC BAA-1334 / A3) TaxID=456320 RepID=D7DU09_METV3|nr:thermonuclease family protein [Methanococcus voltae]MCS3900419.1 micrococcal nuclease [Methanococcus voltae]
MKDDSNKLNFGNCIFYTIIMIILASVLSFSGCIAFSLEKNPNEMNNTEFFNSHEKILAKVDKIVDGDTVYVDVILNDSNSYLIDPWDFDSKSKEQYNKSVIKLRLLGVDTPETYGNNYPDEYITYNGIFISNLTYLKLWGNYAKNYTIDELTNKTVYLIFDKKSDKKGKYGRYLVYIFLENDGRYVNFNEELLHNGYARVYISDFELKEKFLKIEENSKKNKIRMWDYP